MSIIISFIDGDVPVFLVTFYNMDNLTSGDLNNDNTSPSDQLDALRNEYLLLSKKVFRNMNNEDKSATYNDNTNRLNEILKQIKELESRDPRDLMLD